VRKIKPGPTCSVQGPTSKAGPFGLATSNGPYIGCLVVPPDSEGEDVTLRVSAADPRISFSDCDQQESKNYRAP
jgi:hypothetical protein